LNWACSLEDGSSDPGFAKLKSTLPRVDEFVSQLEIEMWKDGDVSVAQHIVDAVPAIKAEPSISSEAPVVEEARATETPAAETTAEPETAESADAEEEQEQKPEIPVVKPALRKPGIKKGQRLSFFDEDEIEALKTNLDAAKSEPKSREVRALFGI